MIDIWSTLITGAISLVSIMISFGLGRWSKTDDFKKEILKERYYNFYVPFFTALVRHRYPSRKYSQIVSIDNFELLNLISDNLQYLDVESAELFKDLYFCQLRLVEFSTGNYPDNEKYFELIDEAFDQFFSFTEREAEYIAQELKLKSVLRRLL